MWRALTTMAFIGRSQSLYKTCIASSHYECPQTRDQFPTVDFRCWPAGAHGAGGDCQRALSTRCLQSPPTAFGKCIFKRLFAPLMETYKCAVRPSRYSRPRPLGIPTRRMTIPDKINKLPPAIAPYTFVQDICPGSSIESEGRFGLKCASTILSTG
jgi:hypothetical protein